MNTRTFVLTAATSLALIAPADSFAFFTPAPGGGAAQVQLRYFGDPALRDRPGEATDLRYASLAAHRATSIAPEAAFRFQVLRNSN